MLTRGPIICNLVRSTADVPPHFVEPHWMLPESRQWVFGIIRLSGRVLRATSMTPDIETVSVPAGQLARTGDAVLLADANGNGAGATRRVDDLPAFIESVPEM